MSSVIFYLSSFNRLFLDRLKKKEKSSLQFVLDKVINFAIEKNIVFEKEIPDRIKTQIRIEETTLVEFDNLCVKSRMSRTEYLNMVVKMYQDETRKGNV